MNPFWILGIFLIVFIPAVIMGAKMQHEQRVDMLDNCKPTEMFVSRYKGGLGRIYDCTDKPPIIGE